MAARKGCSTSQLALAWVMAQDNHIFPIPGTKKLKWLEENVAALQISFSPEELAEINRIAPRDIAAGLRYPETMMKTVNQ